MDPLSELLKKWQPINPAPERDLVRDVMRQIRLDKREPWLNPAWRWLEEILDEWLPTPRILVPVCAALILILSGFQWSKAQERAKEIAALQWYGEISKLPRDLLISGIFEPSN